MHKKRSTNKSESTWIAIIREYLGSGMSKEDFCKNRQLNFLTFKSQYYRLNPKKNPLKLTKAMQPSFIPVTVQPKAMHSGLSIELPNGIKLGVTDIGFDGHKLQELLRVCCNVVNG